MARYELSFEHLDWRGKLTLFVAMIAGLAAAAALIVFALGVALVLVPVGAVAYLVWRWRWNKLVREHAARPADTISVEYHVVGKDETR